MEVCVDRLEREATSSPRITKEAVVNCGSVQETAVEMHTPDDAQDAVNVGCGTQTLEGEPPASPEEDLTCPQVSSRSVIDVTSVPSFKGPVLATASGGSSNSAAKKGDFPRLSEASTPDMDCLVCCNQYSLSRLPKVLTCQHVFCAVCLKLILSHEDDSWRIVCPVCRTATVVFGGLICSLRDQEDLIGCLGNSEMRFSAGAQMGPQLAPPGTFYVHQDDDHINNRVVTKRLLFLLLLLVMIVLLALPFMYPGMLKITLCIAVILGLAMSGVLCFNPKWTFGCSDSSQKRVNHITSVA